MLLIHTIDQYMIHIIHEQTYIILTISVVDSPLPVCCDTYTVSKQYICIIYKHIYDP